MKKSGTKASKSKEAGSASKYKSCEPEAEPVGVMFNDINLESVKDVTGDTYA